MSDNTQLNPGVSGDTIRDIDRTYDQTGVAGGPKTQVVQLDAGGAGSNAESLVSSANPLPVAVPASADQVQRIADLLEAVLVELRILTMQMAQMHQPHPDDREQLRSDLTVDNFQ